MSKFKEFIGLYPLSKTLRFELIPQGKTLENFKTSGILERDEHRSDSYKKMKDIIDNYHRFIIDESLNGFKLEIEKNDKYDSLEDYYTYYVIGKKNEAEKKKFIDIQANLRKQIVDQLKSNPNFKNLFKKELIKKDLVEYVGKDSEDISTVKEFANFTTYFSGFNQNRANMYSEAEKSTSIAFRLINQNLPRFIDNMEVYDKMKNTDVAECFNQIYSRYKEYLNVKKIDDLFQLNYYNILLTQRQIDVYNSIIGGLVTKDGVKEQGLNEMINLYNQNHDKTGRLPKFKILYKQILSERENISFLPEMFANDQETLNAVSDFYSSVKTKAIDKIKEILLHLDNYDKSHIFIKNDNLFLSEISKKLYGDWSYIQKSITEYYKSINEQKKNESSEKYQDRISKLIKVRDSYSIVELDNYIGNINSDKEKIESYFSSLGAFNTEKQQNDNLFLQMENNYASVRDMLNDSYPEDKNLASDKKNVELLKDFLDSIKAIQKFIKPLLGNGDEFGKDASFYGEFDAYYKEINEITALYDKVRNRVTRKPYSTDKIKINFDNPYFLSGWDVNKELENMGIILRKDGLYYLGIINGGIEPDTFNIPKHISSGTKFYEKMEYKFFKDVTTMVPKCSTQLKEVKEHFDKFSSDYSLSSNVFAKPLLITKEIFDLNNTLYGGSKKFQKAYLQKTNDIKGYRRAINVWISFCLDFLKSYRSTMCYNLTSLMDSSQYQSLDNFYDDVNKYLYNISFKKLPEKSVNELVENGNVFLFELYNKDFSAYSRGVPNMHTLYWKGLFDESNLKDIVFKLNGNAEIFYRKSSIKGNDMIIHPRGMCIKNKNVANKKKESKFDYDIIKNRRYTVDKFQFHVPITINFKGKEQQINGLVNEYIKENSIDHIIGIDRGERNLLYLSLINMDGIIVKQFSMNEVTSNYAGNKYAVDYHSLLDVKEGDRREARRNWQTIERIKDLKEGYLSQVIHEICKLMVQYNAIVVLENLNIGFMRGRQKVEKQVYEKFEKMLIDKLNYLADKKLNSTLDGGILRGYQLTNKFISFKSMGDQNGFLFYIPAWNTSRMDPVTGFVNLFDTHYENREKTKSFFSKFDFIRYNNKEDYFEFKFDYKQFTDRAEGTKSEWTICTQGERVETFRNMEKNSEWDSQTINLTEHFKNLFVHYKIDYSGNLKEFILSQTDKQFFEDLFHLFRLTVQMRNSVSNSDIDYIISPAKSSNGVFFNSNIERERGKDDKGNWISNLPIDADANGAYNIARKGLWVINQIKQVDSGDKIKLAVSNKEWLSFAQHFND